MFGTGKQIAHAPVKSIMGRPHLHRRSRPLSTSGSGSKLTDGVSSGSAVDLSRTADPGTVAQLTAQQMSLLGMASPEALQFAAGTLPAAAMFGPLALSTFVHGFGGLVAAASPFLSYYAAQMPNQASLASLVGIPGV